MAILPKQTNPTGMHTCAPKEMYKKVQTSTICYSPKLEKPKCPSKRLDKL